MVVALRAVALTCGCHACQRPRLANCLGRAFIRPLCVSAWGGVWLHGERKAGSEDCSGGTRRANERAHELTGQQRISV